jgi:cytochrome c-type biogenesis protein CcmH/NrfF
MRSRIRIAAVSVAAVALVVCTTPLLAEGPMGQREVEEALTCQCGCGLTVAACNHLECSFAVPVRKDVAESLAAGQTGEQILERYKNEYGEKVLSSPVPEGFNLLAWIAPYLAIVTAGVAMFAVLRRRASVATPHLATPSDIASGPPPAPDARLGQLQRELDDLER